MVHLLHAGFLAAQHQIAMVVLITTTSLIGAHILAEKPSELIDVAAFWGSASTFLTWAYLITATGLSFTSGEHIDETAENIKRATRAGRLGPTKRVLERLVAQSGLSSVAFAVALLWGTPWPLVDMAKHFGVASAMPIIWAALTSIFVAAFSATAHAAYKASRHS